MSKTHPAPAAAGELVRGCPTVIRHFTSLVAYLVRLCSLVGGVPAFQPSSPIANPDVARDLNIYPGTDVCHWSVFFPVLSLTVTQTFC